jgi:hypothetical protein
VESNWVHSALRPPMAYCASPGRLWSITTTDKLEWLAGENRSTRRKPAPVPLCPPQTPHAARTRTRAPAVGRQRLTAWATARPSSSLLLFQLVRWSRMNFVPVRRTLLMFRSNHLICARILFKINRAEVMNLHFIFDMTGIYSRWSMFYYVPASLLKMVDRCFECVELNSWQSQKISRGELCIIISWKTFLIVPAFYGSSNRIKLLKE